MTGNIKYFMYMYYLSYNWSQISRIFLKYASLKNDVKYLYFSFHNTEILETSTGTFQISCKPFIVTCTFLDPILWYPVLTKLKRKSAT